MFRRILESLSLISILYLIWFLLFYFPSKQQQKALKIHIKNNETGDKDAGSFLKEKVLNFMNIDIKDEETREKDTNNSSWLERYVNGPCIHPEIEPFDPDILEFYEMDDLFAIDLCRPRAKLLTKLKDQRVIELYPKNYTCWARCNFFKTYKTHKSSEWVPANSQRFLCDIVQTRCSLKMLNITSAVYDYIHTQIIEREILPPKVEAQGKQYSVHIILVDSTSHTQSFRNLPHLKEYLSSEFDAVDFPYLNKYSDSSRDNLIAISFGKILHKIERARNETDLFPDKNWEKSCNRNLDKETRLIREFEEYGYVTNQIDDWWATLNLDCNGNLQLQSHHIFLPYVVEYEKNIDLVHQLYRFCLERHVDALKYAGQFFKAYKGKPKFSFTWMSHIGHNKVWGSIRAEPDLIRLFEENKEEINNSFVFLMADHGLRHTNAASTRIGEYERSNPMLTVLVPSELRNNSDLMKTLRRNSEELQTHFDTRATLLDILKYQPISGYSDRELLEIPGELGSSYFREQPMPRNCETLPILKEYCICDCSMKNDILETEPETVKKFGIAFIQVINDELVFKFIEWKCGLWAVKKVNKMSLQDVVRRRRFDSEIVTINIVTNRTALFKVSSYESETKSVEIKTYDRLDFYGTRGECEDSPLKNICDCGGWEYGIDPMGNKDSEKVPQL